VQQLRLLTSRRSARWAARRFVAEGAKLLDEALRSGAPVESVFVDPATATEAHRELAAQARRAGATVHEVQPGVLDRVCDAATPQPVTSIIAMVDGPLDAIPVDGFTVVCVGLADPGNAGTVIRSAAASGSGAVVFSAGAVDMYNPKTVRASAGAMFRLPVVAGDGHEPDAVLQFLGSRQVVRVAAVARGGRAHDEHDWTGPTALVLGNETHGLGAGLESGIDVGVTIRMDREVESLNVAMAATVLCFEAARQRRHARGAA
jgi:RNA methyltransferase, TrmH family